MSTPLITFTLSSNGIYITVTPIFVAEQSNFLKNIFVWTYTVYIENKNPFPVQLLRRHWKIFDSTGVITEVKGDGVIGLQPVLQTNNSHQYTSATIMKAPHGMMLGNYTFLDLTTGKEFIAPTPSFSLDSPYNVSQPD